MSEEKQTSTSKASDENRELQKQLKELKRANEEKEMKIKRMEGQALNQPSTETQAIIEDLQKQVEEIKNSQSSKPVYNASGKKEKYRPVTKDDIGDNAITYTARCVTKVIPGYLDENGVEVLAPHKIIVMNYAASDIRQDGKEQDILNFCSYTTKLKSEIKFLESHPEYGITFGKNMNEVAGHDPKEYEFKTKAAEMAASMSPESILSYAEMMKIPNYRRKSNKELRLLIVHYQVEQFKKESETLQDKLKKSILDQALKASQTN